MNSIIGQKNRVLGILGQKIKQGEALGMKVGRQIDVGSRKIANTSRTVGNVLTVGNEFVRGTPLEMIGTVGRDIAKLVEEGARGARAVGQDIEKTSRRGLMNSINDQSKNFV
jgi:hypothetical protein